ncbi:hypothetical protein CDD82_2431 [Ophiocordyceps australis]|uniref:Uncharacterized protein n=1 Tax=Ophiocordyceps australis TaxID=1399860 RepID=A0A2C5XWY7_9HYPO|nr:hypothetical protein CDD82_2431 [Ophiocordyceps australis]
MQNFFEFLGGSICGIPSVKLQGEKQDWVNLLGKLDHLEEFGEEPTEFARVLRPILQGFVQSWDEPNSPATLEFWSKIVLSSASHICGTKAEASGWITGFYFWNSDGDIVFTREKRDSMVAGSMLGDVKYIRVQVKLLPVSYAKVPLKLTDYPGLPGEHHVNLMAGNIGIYRTTNRAKNAVSAEPMSGWYMYGPVDPNRRLSSNSGNKDELASITTSFEECPASY